SAVVGSALGSVRNVGLGVYHAGVEWKWWLGPQECSGALDDLGSAGGLLKKLESISIVRCDEAAWRFLGLSLAGYNAIISLALAAVAAWAAATEWERLRSRKVCPNKRFASLPGFGQSRRAHAVSAHAFAHATLSDRSVALSLLLFSIDPNNEGVQFGYCFSLIRTMRTYISRVNTS